ncbi:DNA-binding protein [Bradyrhizobium hipponense]|uniref:DNA-binding protein n=1 Tax=Bradyrhizobium hipponense TaxID=2605638 RepID=A0A5S4YN07_9BRAD|nr:DNA-binding protein [Bradyrhizobium hipponense]TYO65750.1 DNA-binding protein [Bradyrhizobium hipponense]
MRARENDRVADDLLEGANEIARFLFGPKGRRRRVYYLIATSGLPVFRLGETICARRSTLRSWIAEQENAARAKGNVGKSAPMAAKV